MKYVGFGSTGTTLKNPAGHAASLATNKGTGLLIF